MGLESLESLESLERLESLKRLESLENLESLERLERGNRSIGANWNSFQLEKSDNRYKRYMFETYFTIFHLQFFKKSSSWEMARYFCLCFKSFSNEDKCDPLNVAWATVDPRVIDWRISISIDARWHLLVLWVAMAAVIIFIESKCEL